jgi:hypothetical protein
MVLVVGIAVDAPTDNPKAKLALLGLLTMLTLRPPTKAEFAAGPAFIPCFLIDIEAVGYL